MVQGSFAENLQFLLDALKSGKMTIILVCLVYNMTYFFISAVHMFQLWLEL